MSTATLLGKRFCFWAVASQRGGQLGRQRERRQSAEILALNAARVAARQDAQGVLLLSYLMLKRRDLRTG